VNVATVSGGIRCLRYALVGLGRENRRNYPNWASPHVCIHCVRTSSIRRQNKVLQAAKSSGDPSGRSQIHGYSTRVLGVGDTNISARVPTVHKTECDHESSCGARSISRETNALLLYYSEYISLLYSYNPPVKRSTPGQTLPNALSQSDHASPSIRHVDRGNQATSPPSIHAAASAKPAKRPTRRICQEEPSPQLFFTDARDIISEPVPDIIDIQMRQN